MDNHFFLTDDILWDYADDLLAAQEKQQVEAYLKQHPEWQAKLTAIRAEQRALATLPLQKPGAGFSDRVMATWTAEHMKSFAAAAPPKKRDWIILTLAGSMGMLILAPIVVMVIAAIGATPAEISVPTIQTPSIDTDIWAQALAGPVFQTALIGIFAILMLRIIDKYLRQKTALQRLING
jgi:anti-sigma factor RsiW